MTFFSMLWRGLSAFIAAAVAAGFSGEVLAGAGADESLASAVFISVLVLFAIGGLRGRGHRVLAN